MTRSLHRVPRGVGCGVAGVARGETRGGIPALTLGWALGLTLLGGMFARAALAEERWWTDDSGRFRVRAELLEVALGKARLKKSNGAVVEVPVERLSAADREFLAARARALGERNLVRRAPPANTPQQWALLVGVNDYAAAQDLQYCGRDMERLKEQLVAGGVPADQAFVLVSGAADARLTPYRANVRAQLDLLLGALDAEGQRRLKPGLAEEGDTIILAFSGHGVHWDGASYLCPADARLDDPATLLSVDRLHRQLALCPAAVKVLLIDACRNDPRPKGERSFGEYNAREFAASWQRPPTGTVVLSSCAPGQVSLEDDRLRHGVFMHYVLEGLGGAADQSEGNRDGRVSLLELYRHAHARTKTHAARLSGGLQTPELHGKLVGDVELARAAASGPTETELAGDNTPSQNNTPSQDNAASQLSRIEPAAKPRGVAEALKIKGDVEFVETPLSDVLEYFRDKYGVSVAEDAAALADARMAPLDGFDEKAARPAYAVTLRLTNVSLETQLEQALRPHRLTFVVARDEMILVTTPAAAAKQRPAAQK